MVFVLGGALVALPAGREGLKRVLAAFLMSAFAITFDWIAFGPGERHFSGGISFGIGVGFNPGEWMGRALFGIGGVITTIVSIVMWVRVFRGDKR
jgi:hypothetical protein